MTVARSSALTGVDRALGTSVAADLQRYANAGRLAASVSHELLSALGVAQTDVGYLCDLLAKLEADPDRDLRDAADDARAAIARAVSRIAAVLSLARPRRGEVAPLDVREVIGAALFDLDARLASYTVVRELQQSPFALAERGALLQVLVSLLLDAADATPQRGRIGVRLRAQGDSVLVSIDDEGPSPISPESLAEQPPLRICRDVVRSFGGDLMTGAGPLGGRLVTIRLHMDRIG